MEIAGKDYLTILEAAHYCGVSERQFRKEAPKYGLIPVLFMGKKVYPKKELRTAMDKAWLESTSEGVSGGSHGQPLMVGSVSLLARQTRRGPKSSGGQRNSNSKSAGRLSSTAAPQR